MKLDQLESMRLTLHGCHRIDVSATVYVSQNEDGRRAPDAGGIRS